MKSNNSGIEIYPAYPVAPENAEELQATNNTWLNDIFQAGSTKATIGLIIANYLYYPRWTSIKEIATEVYKKAQEITEPLTEKDELQITHLEHCINEVLRIAGINLTLKQAISDFEEVQLLDFLNYIARTGFPRSPIITTQITITNIKLSSLRNKIESLLPPKGVAILLKYLSERQSTEDNKQCIRNLSKTLFTILNQEALHSMKKSFAEDSLSREDSAIAAYRRYFFTTGITDIKGYGYGYGCVFPCCTLTSDTKGYFPNDAQRNTELFILKGNTRRFYFPTIHETKRRPYYILGEDGIYYQDDAHCDIPLRLISADNSVISILLYILKQHDNTSLVNNYVDRLSDKDKKYITDVTYSRERLRKKHLFQFYTSFLVIEKNAKDFYFSNSIKRDGSNIFVLGKDALYFYDSASYAYEDYNHSIINTRMLVTNDAKEIELLWNKFSDSQYNTSKNTLAEHRSLSLREQRLITDLTGHTSSNPIINHCVENYAFTTLTAPITSACGIIDCACLLPCSLIPRNPCIAGYYNANSGLLSCIDYCNESIPPFDDGSLVVYRRSFYPTCIENYRERENLTCCCDLYPTRYGFALMNNTCINLSNMLCFPCISAQTASIACLGTYCCTQDNRTPVTIEQFTKLPDEYFNPTVNYSANTITSVDEKNETSISLTSMLINPLTEQDSATVPLLRSTHAMFGIDEKTPAATQQKPISLVASRGEVEPLTL